MSSSESSLDSSSASEYSDSEYEVEIDDSIVRSSSACSFAKSAESSIGEIGETVENESFAECLAYSEEPLADEEWLIDYNKKVKEVEELEQELVKRLDGTTAVSEWCKCGNCETTNLQNLSECYCCSELEGCVDALTSEFVLQDLEPEAVLKCIIEHPGFDPVCLQKWSLRLAADNYRTKGRKSYKQTGTEERFLRSVAYREFSRLVYGFLGNKRYPLPACAYSAIRKKFVNEQEEGFRGFEMEEEIMDSIR